MLSLVREECYLRQSWERGMEQDKEGKHRDSKYHALTQKKASRKCFPNKEPNVLNSEFNKKEQGS